MSWFEINQYIEYLGGEIKTLKKEILLWRNWRSPSNSWEGGSDSPVLSLIGSLFQAQAQIVPASLAKMNTYTHTLRLPNFPFLASRLPPFSTFLLAAAAAKLA